MRVQLELHLGRWCSYCSFDVVQTDAVVGRRMLLSSAGRQLTLFSTVATVQEIDDSLGVCYWCFQCSSSPISIIRSGSRGVEKRGPVQKSVDER